METCTFQNKVADGQKRPHELSGSSAKALRQEVIAKDGLYQEFQICYCVLARATRNQVWAANEVNALNEWL